jgi:hypothetical protein
LSVSDANILVQDRTKTTSDIKLVSWPSPQDYNEAVQNPALNFSDPELRKGQPSLSPLGLPRPITGHFASVYRVHSSDKDWAVRCFLQNHPDHQQRYEHIADHLSQKKLDCTVAFHYQPEGICVGNTWYPILKMQWCYGETLNSYIERNRFNRRALERLADAFKRLVYDLRKNDITHGDLQHGNIIVDNEKLRLVDYDGMFVPSLASFQSHELGHRSYQHPGRTGSQCGSYLDNFPAWLIYLSLKILTYAPELWLRFDGGDECILLSQADLEQPAKSKAFHDMERHPNEEVRKGSRLIRYFLSLPIEDVPVPDFDAPQPVPAHLPPVNPAAKQTTVVLDYDDDESYGYDYDESVLILPPKYRKTSRKRRLRQKLSRQKRLKGQQAQTGQGTLPTWMQQGRPAGSSTTQTSAGSGTQSSVTPRQALRTTLNNLLAGRPVLQGTPRNQHEAIIQRVLIYLVSALFLLMLVGSFFHTITSPPTVRDRLTEIADSIQTAPEVTLNDKGESNLLTTGNLYYQQGRYEEAWTAYLDVTAYFFDKDSATSDLNLASAYNNLGILEVRKGKNQEGLAYFSDSIKYWEHLEEVQPTAYAYAGHAQAEFNLGLAHQMQERYESAVKHFKAAKVLYKKTERMSKAKGSRAQEIQKCNQRIYKATRLMRRSG